MTANLIATSSMQVGAIQPHQQTTTSVRGLRVPEWLVVRFRPPPAYRLWAVSSEGRLTCNRILYEWKAQAVASNPALDWGRVHMGVLEKIRKEAFQDLSPQIRAHWERVANGAKE